MPATAGGCLRSDGNDGNSGNGGDSGQKTGVTKTIWNHSLANVPHQLSCALAAALTAAAAMVAALPTASRAAALPTAGGAATLTAAACGNQYYQSESESLA